MHCGTGPMLAVIVGDSNPNYDVRITSKGDLEVNANIFDEKMQLRKMTGGGHKIHATNNNLEAEKDIKLLLHKNIKDYYELGAWDLVIKKWNEDIIGNGGWRNLYEYFSILNLSCKYVVLRNFECFPHQYHLENHGDIDLLTDDIDSIVCVSNAKQVFEEKYRVCYTVNIDNIDIPFDIRYLGDNYYDYFWELDILNNRVLDNGFYKPDSINYYYSLMYHGIIHKETLQNDTLTIYTNS